MRVEIRQHAFYRAFEELAVVHLLHISVFDATEYFGKFAKVVQWQLFFRIG